MDEWIYTYTHCWHPGSVTSVEMSFKKWAFVMYVFSKNMEDNQAFSIRQIQWNRVMKEFLYF